MDLDLNYQLELCLRQYTLPLYTDIFATTVKKISYSVIYVITYVQGILSIPSHLE